MAPIIWDNLLETGHEELDGQHRTLVDTFNRLSAVAGQGGRTREELEGLLIFLRDYTLKHFETEQELMARHGYPHETEHRRIHSDLAGQMEAFLEGFHRGTTTLTPVTLKDLDAWLRQHIREEDFRLAEFLKHAESLGRGSS